MADRFRQEVSRLREALNEPSRREEAAEISRGLIDTIVLQPQGDGQKRWLSIDLTGHLAGILLLAGVKRREAGASASDQQIKLVAGDGLGLGLPKTDDLDRQIKLVAGVGFEPTNFGYQPLCSSVHRRERSSPVRNRMPEIGAYGSVLRGCSSYASG